MMHIDNGIHPAAVDIVVDVRHHQSLPPQLQLVPRGWVCGLGCGGTEGGIGTNDVRHRQWLTTGMAYGGLNK